MVTASTFSDDQLSTSRKAKLLFQRLPRELQKQLAILNFEECTTKKLASRVKNYLDWMSVGDQKAWKDHLADYMDIDTVNMANENEDKQDPQINNFGNNERVVLPRNLINWSKVNNIPSFMMAFRCLMRTHNSLRNEVTQWLYQRPNGNPNNRRSNTFSRRPGFRPQIRRNINEIDDFDSKLEEDKFDIFDIPLTGDTQNNDGGGDLSSHEQVNTGFPIGAAKKDSSIDDKNISKEAARRLLHCKIHLNDQGTQALIDTGAGCKHNKLQHLPTIWISH